LITKADGQSALPSVTGQENASFSLSFRPQSHMTEFFQQCTDDIVAAVEAKRAKEGQRPKIRILPV
jgi:hypothetical protein